MIIKEDKLQNVLSLFVEIESHKNFNKLENEFEEFQSLIISADLVIVDKLLHKQKSPVINTFISKGKLEEIKNIIKDQDIDLIIINHQLSASQNRNLEIFFNVRVIDKTELILDIFASRASSYIGKLQVELAQLKHLSTRLIRGWTHLELSLIHI